MEIDMTMANIANRNHARKREERIAKKMERKVRNRQIVEVISDVMGALGLFVGLCSFYVMGCMF